MVRSFVRSLTCIGGCKLSIIPIFGRSGAIIALPVPAEAEGMGIDRLEDEDYPVLSVSQAAELLGVQPAFLRRLDAAGVVSSDRSVGGHRRYSRRQLVRAARMRELLDQGHTLAAAAQILGLQDDLDRVRDERDQARDERDQARGERDEARGRWGQAPTSC
jgi:MerR family transcriptional regulator, heat shock protein HspR